MSWKLTPFLALVPKVQSAWGRALLAIALLTSLGYLGNYFSFPVFWGVDFLFGSIATLMVGCWFGPVAGAIAAALASTYTYQLWSHPYAIIIFTIEVVFVSVGYHRYRLNLVLLDGLYWLFPGPLLTVLFYKGVMGFATTPTQVIALKQMVNGLFNALVASALMLALSSLSRHLWNRQRAQRSPLRLQVILSDVLVAAVFLPTLLLIAVNSSNAVADIEEAVANRLGAVGGELRVRVEVWQDKALATVGAIAKQLAGIEPSPERLAPLLTTAQGGGAAITTLAVVDQDSRTLADNPTALDPATLALEPGGSAQFQPLTDPNRPGEVGLAAIAALEADRFLVATLDLVDLEQRLAAALGDTNLEVVVLSTTDQVLARTLPELSLLDTFSLDQRGDARPLAINQGSLDRALWQVLPPEPGLALVARFRQSSYWLRLSLGPRFLQSLWIQGPAQPYIDRLQQSYVRQLARVWAIAVLALIAATVISNRLTRPLQDLARLTADLPEQISRGHTLAWPTSLVAEFAALAHNFQHMATSLAARFQEIQQANDTLEARIKERTQDLTVTNTELAAAIQQLQATQTQLVQTEKMSSLGNLVAGVAHEINNPVNFIHGNLFHIESYVRDLLAVIRAYQNHIPNPPSEVQELSEELEIDFIAEDCPKSLQSMRLGTQRIRDIVGALRNFSRIDEAELKEVNLHEGLESTLMILHNRLKPKSDRLEIQVIKDYGELPLVECYAGHLNQVFMNILANAIDALEERDRHRSPAEQTAQPSQIRIRTEAVDRERICIWISDNGPGIPDAVQVRLFDPFFTTKEVGKGTGLGMSISRQIVVEQHGGTLYCHSQLSQGSEFRIEIPCRQTAAKLLLRV